MKLDKEKILYRLKKIGIITLWIVLLGRLVMSLAFVNREADEVTCSKISVTIRPENELLFVDRETVIRAIRDDGNENLILGKKIHSLHIPRLEKKLLHNTMISGAEVFTDMNGVLAINITQREPVLRILKPDGTGFYIDRRGLKMPLSERFTARVLVATGNIYESYSGHDSLQSVVCNELFKIATYVDKDAFWKAQIEQIFVNAESDLVLIPKVGDHQIIFGDAQNMEEKFGKLMLFYREGLSHMGWDKYKSINLSYKGQIVCVKKSGFKTR
jgi:cell division protein FtsQ